MDSGILAVLVILVLLVVGVNGLLILALRRGQGNEQSRIRLFQRAARRARSPWEQEDSDLAELSRLVEPMKKKDK